MRAVLTCAFLIYCPNQSTGIAQISQSSYGTEAAYDGELYTPGLDSQIYPNAVTYELPTRTITMDYNGAQQMFLTDASVLFMPVSHYGNFSVDGLVFSSSSLFLTPEGEEYEKFNFLLNPSSTGSGFDSIPSADGTGKLSWTPIESMEEE